MHRLLTLAVACCLGTAAEPLVIHEWGTFTSLQDGSGRTIGGLNTDEEELPAFVHQLGPIALARHGDLAPRYVKMAPRLAPEVTMRLETPVVYVHLPPGERQAVFDLGVTFRGGLLSQFFPAAEALVDGALVSDRQQHRYRTLAGDSTSTLTWRGIVAGAAGEGPTTDSPVWLAPRRVDAASLLVGDERERYLFYRGLAHLDAPLTILRVYPSTTIGVSVRPSAQATVPTLPDFWFADLRGDGTAAVRHVRPDADQRSAHYVDTGFKPEDYSAEALAGLRAGLHAALVVDGLFADEAEALLATWESSYFTSAGQRIFFLVPRAWTDAHLPLTVSRDARIVRSMVGRIEVVSPAQELALARLAEGPVSSPDWYEHHLRSLRRQDGKEVVWIPGGKERTIRIQQGEPGVLAELGIAVPDDYAAYLSLGRFRDALVQHRLQITRDPELAAFHDAYLVDQITRMLRLSATRSADATAAP